MSETIVTQRQRERYARALDKTVTDGARQYLGWYSRPVTRSGVVDASAPALLAIADVLRDADREIPAGAFADLKQFLTQGAVSPLYGRDALLARTTAEGILTKLAGGVPAPAVEARQPALV